MSDKPSSTSTASGDGSSNTMSYQASSASSGSGDGSMSGARGNQRSSASQNVSGPPRAAYGFGQHGGDDLGSSEEKKMVQFNSLGQPIGEGSTTFSTFLGLMTRTHCPIFYDQWRDVPDQIKEMIWQFVMDEYIVDAAYKRGILQMINNYWRCFKCRLRQKHYDIYDTDEERKRNCPRGFNQEDWDRFVDIQSTSTMQVRRERGKSAREAMKNVHTSGRLGSARIAEALKKADPSATITRTDVYLATHSRIDGSFLTPQLEKIKAIAERDPSSASLDVDHDPVAQVFGPEGKGRVRGMGIGVSKTALSFSAPAENQLQREKRKRLHFEEHVTAQGQMITKMKEQIAMFDQMIMDIREQIACQGLQRLFSTTSTRSHVRSPPHAESQVVQSPRRAQLCELLQFGDVVVATGRALRGGSLALGDGGNQPLEDVYNVIIEDVHDPNARLFRPDKLTLGDVELGAVIKWPKLFTRLLS